VFTDPLGEEDPLGDHVFGQFRNPPGFEVNESSNITQHVGAQHENCKKN
jgi:hypothetical protein